MKKLVLSSILFVFAINILAQTPKWVEKNKRAVFSIMSYDDGGRIKGTSNGFFISETGTALTDYSVLKGASKAVIFTAEGKELEVEMILGVNEIYDIVKLQIDTKGKKQPFLRISTQKSAKGDNVYVLPYSTQKSAQCLATTVTDTTSVVKDFCYYTLGASITEKMVSCPVMNKNGEVIALSQKSTNQSSETSYAVDVNFANSLKIQALSINDQSLNKIKIQKALPDSEDEATVYMMMSLSLLDEVLKDEIVERFIKKFPESSEGYLRRANRNVTKVVKEPILATQIEADLNKAIEYAKEKDVVFSSVADIVVFYNSLPIEKKHEELSVEKAIKYVEEAIKTSNNTFYKRKKADILLFDKKYNKALEIYRAINSSSEVTSETLFAEANISSEIGKPNEEVLALLDSCIARCTTPVLQKDAEFYWARAVHLMKMNKPRQAVKDYDIFYNAMNGKVSDLFFYTRHQALVKAKYYQRAAEDISKAIELSPDENLYRVEQAVLYLKIGRTDEAIDMLSKIIDKDPKYAEGYRLIGLCYVQKKDMKKACENFHKAKSLGDTNTDSLIEKYCKK